MATEVAGTYYTYDADKSTEHKSLRELEGLLKRVTRTAGSDMPVLVVAGEGSMSNMMAEAAKQIGSNVSTDVAPESCRYIVEENPPWFAERIVGFSDELNAS